MELTSKDCEYVSQLQSINAVMHIYTTSTYTCRQVSVVDLLIACAHTHTHSCCTCTCTCNMIPLDLDSLAQTSIEYVSVSVGGLASLLLYCVDQPGASCGLACSRNTCIYGIALASMWTSSHLPCIGHRLVFCHAQQVYVYPCTCINYDYANSLHGPWAYTCKCA